MLSSFQANQLFALLPYSSPSDETELLNLTYMPSLNFKQSDLVKGLVENAPEISVEINVYKLKMLSLVMISIANAYAR
jgi:hypothetical protein